MKDPYNATTLEAGDDLAYTIKLSIGHIGEDSTLFIAVYKCLWKDAEIGEDDDPQGIKINPPIEFLQLLFPILANYKVADY